MYGLIGKNGVGKTTLLRTISRIISDNEGSISIDGVCIDNNDYFDSPVSYISDTTTYHTDLSVKEHLLLVCFSQKMDRITALEKAQELINSMRLEKYKDYFPNTLSKGTLQRLNIAMGILREDGLSNQVQHFVLKNLKRCFPI